MNNFVYFFTTLVSAFLSIIHLLMLVRVVLSWLPISDDSPVYGFVFSMTEPVVIPVRLILERSETVRNMPIDISFLFAFMLLSIVQSMLPVIG